MSLRIVAARAADLPAIRDLQVASWRRAYRGILPDAFLEDGVVAALSDRWASLPGKAWIVDTAWVGGALAGFISVDRGHGPGAYIDNLHVARDAQGRGVGKALVAGAAATLHGEGVARLWLTVIDRNARARAFYRRLGGAEGAMMPERLYGQPIRALPVEWTDLSALAALADR